MASRERGRAQEEVGPTSRDNCSGTNKVGGGWRSNAVETSRRGEDNGTCFGLKVMLFPPSLKQGSMQKSSKTLTAPQAFLSVEITTNYQEGYATRFKI